MKPRFRNPDKFQVLPFREWIRENLPSGSEGFVAEDLDLVVRVYGHRFNTDAIGKIMFLELKFHPKFIGTSKKNTFGLADAIMRKGDPQRNRYRGWWIVGYDNPDWNKSNFWLNRKAITREEFWAFLMFMNEPVPPYVFPAFLSGFDKC